MSQPLWKNVWHRWSRDQPQTGSFFQRPREPGNELEFVRASHRNREVADSNPVEILIFAKIAFITLTIIASLDFISTVQYMIYFIYVIAILNERTVAPMIALTCLKEASKKCVALAYYGRSANWKNNLVK